MSDSLRSASSNCFNLIWMGLAERTDLINQSQLDLEASHWNQFSDATLSAAVFSRQPDNVRTASRHNPSSCDSAISSITSDAQLKRCVTNSSVALSLLPIPHR